MLRIYGHYKYVFLSVWGSTADVCMLRGSTHYCAIAPRALSRHIVDFLGSRKIDTAPTFIEVLLRPTLAQSDEPSDLRGSLSTTIRHRCTHVLVYTAHGVCQAVTHPVMNGAGVA